MYVFIVNNCQGPKIMQVTLIKDNTTTIRNRKKDSNTTRTKININITKYMHLYYKTRVEQDNNIFSR